MHWRRQWQPTPVFLPGESQGRGSLVGCRLWGHTESNTTEVTQQQQQLFLLEDSWFMTLFQVYSSDSVAVVVQSPTHVRLFATPWTVAHHTSLSLTTSQSLPKFMSLVSVMPSSHLILWCPLSGLPSIFPSIRDFSNELTVHIRWPNYWSFSFSNSLSNDFSGLISLKIDWFELLAVQGTFMSLLHHHSLKASILWHSAFFMV